MLELIALIAALAMCVWTPIETRKVRNGWVRRNFQGTREEFVAKYRRQLTVFFWVGLVLGLGNIALSFVFTGEGDGARQTIKLVAGAIWLAAGVVSLVSRQQLDAHA